MRSALLHLRVASGLIRRDPRRHPPARVRPIAMAATPELPEKASEVLTYWLGTGWATAPQTYLPEEQSKKWFFGGEAVDKEIIERFGADVDALAAGAYDPWKQQPYACLGAIVLGDQLTRNAKRGTAAMFQNDARALAWAKEMVASGADKALRPIERVWVYMPFMHSEALEDQEECMRLFDQLGKDCEGLEGGEALAKMAANNRHYAVLHRDVVARWGRFPHRNATLGRDSTPEEAAGLAAGIIPKF